MTDSQKWLALAGIAALGWVLYRLSPILTPFLIAALLAYLADPLVDRLQAKGLSRLLSVVLVFLALLLGGLCLLLVLVPILQRQIVVLLAKIPTALEWVQLNILPKVAEWSGSEEFGVDAAALRSALREHWQPLGSAFSGVLKDVLLSGQTALGWLVYLVLIPVVTFYLLRDWDDLVARVRDLLPRRIEPRVTALTRECDQVLAEFLRGQVSVMAALGIIYTVGLSIIGLDVALIVGVLAGLVSFVPYLGFIVGIVPAAVAAAIQFHDVLHVLLVFVVFGVGQAIEGMVLSPWLVGERIGLHPVAVIFAVMAGGQLFGFFGVLLALPVAAVLVVMLRHARLSYESSSFYTP